MVNNFTKPFLIAEIGINHNGDINIAKKLIDNAVICGFDAVKFQKRDIDLVYNSEQLDSERESPWGKTFREQNRVWSLNLKITKKLIVTVSKKKYIGLHQPPDLNSLEFLNNFDLKFNKIASAKIVDKKFLEKVSMQKKHTFISTGMSTISDIEDAVQIFKKIP